MKQLLLTALFLISLTSVAWADLWLLEATPTADNPGWGSFSILFNDANDDLNVSIGDVALFSGVTQTTSLYSTLARIPGISILISGEPLSLALLPTVNDIYKLYWYFTDTGGTDHARHSRYWTYTVSAAATPIPGAVWLLGTGAVGLFGLRRRFKG